MLSPRTLILGAAAVVLGPLGIALIGQVLIWMLPGCNPNPYALGECLIGSYNIASILMFATVGGIYVAVIGLLVSVPLLVGALFLSGDGDSLRRQRNGQNGARTRH